MKPQTSTHFETLGAAAAGIAHDLNNQLTLIVNHLSVSNIASAMDALERCSELTTCLLEAGRGETVKLGPVDLAAYLHDFATQLRLPEGIRLFLNVPATLPTIVANPAAVTRALTNLILNACEAMESRGTLRISASKHSIEIADSGPGIDPELAGRVFEPFFTTRGSGGTGLGLAIVRDIMRQHCGSVTLHTEPGRGARFVLRFRPASLAPQGKILKGSPRKIAPAA